MWKTDLLAYAEDVRRRPAASADSLPILMKHAQSRDTRVAGPVVGVTGARRAAPTGTVPLFTSFTGFNVVADWLHLINFTLGVTQLALRSLGACVGLI